MLVRSLIVFYAIYAGIINNQQFTRFVRFNAMQAILLSIILMYAASIRFRSADRPCAVHIWACACMHKCVRVYACSCAHCACTAIRLHISACMLVYLGAELWGVAGPAVLLHPATPVLLYCQQLKPS